MDKKISVIVPVYNAEKYLIRCTDSILNQSHKNIELILVNDGSTDNSLELCFKIAEKDNRVKVFTKDNGGAASARNLGIKKATGDYIGFCDSDDYLDSDMYETLLGLILSKNLNMIECSYKTVDDNGNVIENGLSDNEFLINSAQDAISNLFYWIGGSSLWTRLIKKELFNNLHIPEGRRVEDFYTSICLISENESNAVYNHPFYNYYCNSNSVTHSKGANIYLDALYFREKVLENFGNKYDLKEPSEYFLLKCYYLFSVSIINCEFKKYKNEIKKIKKDLRHRYQYIIKSKRLKSKEKITLIIASFSLRLTRTIYLLKNFL